jgi:membrane-bound lytic murein transglycosylase A
MLANMKYLLLTVLGVLFLSACSRGVLTGPGDSMRLTAAPAVTASQADDLPLAPLAAAVEEQIRFLEKKASVTEFNLGEAVYSKKEYLAGLRRVAELCRQSKDSNELFAQVVREFDFFEVYGREGWGEVFLTSYFEPVIPGSREKSARFSQPLYAKPKEILQIRLKEFAATSADHRTLQGRIENGRVVPYYTRKEIDGEGKLKGKGLELCWVDPVDAFFLQVQGSGTVQLENGEKLRINYAEKNGHPYRPVGAVFRDQIPPDQFNLHTIEQKLRSLSPEAMQIAMNTNPSYVFFRLHDQSAITYMGLPATDGRTVATDQRYFQKGLLGFLMFDKPRFQSPESIQPENYQPASRFVLDQDIGGAITGGGRVDLFWGRGAEAKQAAGVIKHPARLYYLAPKKR